MVCVRVLFLLLYPTIVCCILEWNDAIVAAANAHGSVCTIVDFVIDDGLVGLDSWYVCMDHNYAKYASETSRRMMMSS